MRYMLVWIKHCAHGCAHIHMCRCTARSMERMGNHTVKDTLDMDGCREKLVIQVSGATFKTEDEIKWVQALSHILGKVQFFPLLDTYICIDIFASNS